jgi:hypothetical protein
MSSKPSCGPLTEIASNEAVRVSKCTCGVTHVTLVASGVTLRMPAETLKNVMAGLAAAVAKLDAQPQPIGSTGTTSIN